MCCVDEMCDVWDWVDVVSVVGGMCGDGMMCEGSRAARGATTRTRTTRRRTTRWGCLMRVC